MFKRCSNKKFESRLWTKVAKAIKDFDLIAKGEKVAIAVSGGKDSLTLLYFLSVFKKYKIFSFDFVAVHIVTDVSLEKKAYKPKELENYFKELKIPYEILHVNLSNPKLNKKGYTDCYWCSTQKRRLLFQASEKHGCKKIAFGHHMDDIVVTNLMNAFYISSLTSMKIKKSFINGKYFIIRPLCYLREKEIEKFSKLMKFPATCNCCRVARDGRREQVTEILHNLESEIPEVAQSVFAAFNKNENFS